MIASDLAAMRFVADLICPERCAACDGIVAAPALFCRACATHVRELGPPECATCGAPGACRACVGDSAIRTSRAWAAYRQGAGTNPVARAIARFKYGGAVRLGRRLAAKLLARVREPTIDLLVPVPLHVQRLRARGFNQSAVLARHVARYLGRPVRLDAVTRTRPTPTQVTLSPSARAANVAGAFAVRRPELVARRRVLVIDDVWTSGATARAVAATLRAAGASAVDVLTVARVL